MRQEARTINPGDRLISASDLPLGSCRVFSVLIEDQETEIILVHTSQGFRACLNRCRHLPVSLDWGDGEVLDDTGHYFQCRTHGALFRVTDGLCVAGPCNGKSLHPILIEEKADAIHFIGLGVTP